jgi:choline dehydrogenase-like flavoprotein
LIYTHAHLAGADTRLAVDCVVIGSGAGGAPVAAELAARGKRVVVLEAGSYWRPEDFTQVEYDMFQRLYADKAGRQTRDKAIHVHQGQGVGGSTLHNLNLCKRVPPEILAEWRAQHGWKHLPPATLDALYDEVEARLSVTKLATYHLNGNNAALERGCRALGYRGDFLHHNRVGCAASGFCELGCPYDAKQNALKIYLADAVGHGADVLADTWAARVEYSGRNAARVHAVVRDPRTGAASAHVTIDARAVCVSASATGTPALLLRSSVPDPHRLVGSRLFLHPGAAVAARFPEPLASWRGVPQSYECTEFLDFAPGATRRVWIICSFAHPAGVSSQLSSFGAAHAAALRDYPHLAALSPMVHDLDPGRVNVAGTWGIDLDYRLSARDAAQLHLGLRESARLLLAAGAEKVLVPLARTVEIAALADVDAAFARIRVEPYDTDVTAVHPMGSVWMGDAPERACVDSTGRYHHLDNLFVADTSLYPSSIGAPPQITAYTLGTHVGRQIAAYLG